MKSVVWTLGALALGLEFSSGLSLAQTTSSAGASGNTDSAQAEGLQEIIVTAQRRAESLQKVALAVDVISSDSILAAGVNKAQDLNVLVPSLQVSSGGGSTTNFYIRGVGAFTANAYTDSAVAFNYDGVYVSRPSATSGVFYDVERVEVLKGPQGTLYGRNATGGAINVLPAKPRLGETSGYAELSYGNFDAINFQGAVNIPVGQQMAMRLSGMIVHRNGYMSDGTDDDIGQAVRAQFLFEPSDDLNIRLAADYYHDGGRGNGASFAANAAFNPVTGTYSIVPSGLRASTGVFDPASAAFLGETFSGVSGRTLGPLPGSPKLDNNTGGVNAELNWHLPIATLTVEPAYRESKQDSVSAGGGFVVGTRETDKQETLEARLASNTDGRLKWLLGGFVYHESIDSPAFNVQMQALDSFQSFEQTSDSYAGFGRLTFSLTDAVRLVGGLRYTNDRRKFDGSADVLVDACASPTGVCPGAPLLPGSSSAADTIAQLGLLQVAPGVYIQPSPAGAATIFARGLTALDLHRSDSKLTYHAGLEWDAGPSSLVYASYDTGYRSGGFAFSSFRPEFGPETIEAYTLGAKNRFFDNKLQLNLELFLWKYKDQQVSHLGPDEQLGSAFYTENIGRSTNKGFELELQYQPVRDLTLTADLQYLQASYDSFVFQQPAFSNGNPAAPPLTGCAVTPPATFAPGANYTVNCSGQSAFRSPRWTANVGAEQTIHVGDYQFRANLNTRYQASNLTGFEFLSAEVQPAFWMTNAWLAFEPAHARWNVTAFVNNIENKRRINLSYLNGPTSTIANSYSAPLTYGVRAGFKF